MAHFAQIKNNIVQQVIVVDNTIILDSDGKEQESLGVDFCHLLLGQDTQWVQTSYNGNFRKNYSGIGSTYDSTRDAFIEPQPYESWVLNEDTCRWEAPIPDPNTEEDAYYWDEPSLSWIQYEDVEQEESE